MSAKLLVVLLASAALCPAEMFPLQVGNQWVYRTVEPEITDDMVLAVTQSHVFQGKTYYKLEGLRSGPYWLRNDGPNTYSYDEKMGEQPWYRWDQRTGTIYFTVVPGGLRHGTIDSRDATVDTPAGTFTGATQLRYAVASQVDPAVEYIASEYYVDGIGLAKRVEHMGGTVVSTHALLYARVGDTTYIGAPEWSVRLSLSPASTLARLSVRAPNDTPVNVTATLRARIWSSSGTEIWSSNPEQQTLQAAAGQEGFLFLNLAEGLAPGDYAVRIEFGPFAVTSPWTIR